MLRFRPIPPHADMSLGDGPVKSESLTQRQHAILQLVAEGLSNKEIARCMEMSVETVRGDLKKVYSALRVPNRTAAALTYTQLFGGTPSKN